MPRPIWPMERMAMVAWGDVMVDVVSVFLGREVSRVWKTCVAFRWGPTRMACCGVIMVIAGCGGFNAVRLDDPR